MKKSILFLLVLVIYSCQTEQIPETSIKIGKLLCEYEVNPLGIDTPEPRFTWVMSSSEKGQHQTAYQILVASSSDLLDNDRGNIWDSGKVLSDQSSLVEYKGEKLKSGTRYFQKVRVWDQADKMSAYSQVAWWETGLFNKQDWKASWISAPRAFDFAKIDQRRKIIPKDAPPEMEEPAPMFRKEFKVNDQIKQVRAYISGLGFYELSINNRKVGDHVLTPSFTDYSKTVQYITYDISDYLDNGVNAIGVLLGNGWYNMKTRDVWSFDRAPWIADPTFILQVVIEYQNGEKQLIVSDETWKCAPGPIIFNQVRQGETYDANMEQAGWDEPGFDDSGWFPIRKVRGPEGSLITQTNQPSKIMKELPPVSIKEVKKGIFVADFGQNMAGFVKLKVSGPKNTLISMKYGERVNNDGTVDQKENHNLVADVRFQTDTYTLKGEGMETWHARFVYHGFQYVEISGFPGVPNTDNLTACAVHTSFPKAGTFQCSNELLNQIQHNTEWSFINNYTAGFPTDCPQREKNGWTGDAQLASEAGLYNFNISLAYSKWLRDIRDSQRPDGMVSCVVPTGGWGYYWGNGPAWDHALFAIPWHVYLYTGDIRILEENYKAMKHYMALLETIQEDYLVNWGLGDWLPAKTITPAIITSTAYYHENATIMARIAGLLNEAEDQLKYTELAPKIRNAFNEAFFDTDEMTYGNGSQTALGSALYYGLVEKEHEIDVLNTLVKNIRDSELNLDFGILGSKYVPNALAENDRKDVFFDMVNTTRFPGWGNWIERGATTLWESWQGDNSLNHIMFGDVSAWFYKYLAGIQVDEEYPGFKQFYIDPYFPEGLDWVEGSYPSPQGEITVRWERDENDIVMKIKLPLNSKAILKLKLDSPDALETYEGTPPEEHIKYIGLQNGKESFEIQPGTYILKIKKVLE
ncbi:family 78 glycoside hydrolase catalytic domain [Bacteroidota bacterium]